ncbi:Jerky-like protein [Plakobranchus ocellatus]|uniref:Jerky-like protein n=1 Tax=Plakobranchus ocellatus TaxID=259542 RepID=A0AAV3YLT4_9GAST|nr:Jerky-like protein [Plakobranchus ocellatus]
MYNHPGKRQTIHDVAGILGAAYSRAFTLDTAISGFRATGICPLNDEVFSEGDFYQCYLSDTLCQQPMDTETPTPTNQDATPCSARTSAADCPADPNAASHCLTLSLSTAHLKTLGHTQKPLSRGNEPVEHWAEVVTVKATASWTVNDLNQILIFRDYLYKEIDEQLPENEHGYLLISEIPHRISLFGTTVYLQRSRSLCGIIASVQLSQAAPSINEAISQGFERHPSAIVILKDTSMMIHKDPESRIWLFDSHSRNEDGMPAPDEVGKSILINLKDMADLNLYCAMIIYYILSKYVPPAVFLS